MKTQTIAINAIKVGKRARGIDYDFAQALSASIEEFGLQQPIGVTADNRLVFGLHRLQACRLLKKETIKAFVLDISDLEARQIEIDENLVRNELTLLERAEALAERKRYYLALHPETKGGTAGAKARWNANPESGSASTPSFIDDMATKTGESRSVIAEEIAMVGNIPSDVRDWIRKSPVADKKSELQALARKTPSEQRKIAKKIASGELSRVTASEKPKREGDVVVLKKHYDQLVSLAKQVNKIANERYETMKIGALRQASSDLVELLTTTINQEQERKS